jgi:hypothetical protein
LFSVFNVREIWRCEECGRGFAVEQNYLDHAKNCAIDRELERLCMEWRVADQIRRFKERNTEPLTFNAGQSVA